MSHPGPAPLDLETLLRDYGPIWNGGPPRSDKEIFERLEAFGRALPLCPSPTQRAWARDNWIEFLRTQTVPAPGRPDRIVDEAIRAGAPEAALSSSLHWYADGDLEHLPEPEHLIAGGYLPDRALVELYGPTGCGKTFVALDMALSVGTGAAWHGHRVHHGPVAYILAEGRGGLAGRVRAWREARSWRKPMDVRFLTQPVNLLSPVQARRLLDDVAAWEVPPRLMTFDTVAMCLTPGDENSTRDMGLFVSELISFREAIGCTVLTVHHAGRDSSHARGSSSLDAAMDAVMRLRTARDVLTLSSEKVRDGTHFRPIPLRLRSVGPSVVPELVSASAADDIEVTDGLTKSDQKVLHALRTTTSPEGVSSGDWERTSDLSHGQFHRSQKKLLKRGLVRSKRDGRYVRYWPTDAETDDK